MRIRSLLTYLSGLPIAPHYSVEELRGIVLGIDAVFWLRSIPELKDPFACVIGGIPTSLFATIDQQLDHFKRLEITPVFVFDGIQNRTHNLFVMSYPDSMKDGWSAYRQGKIEQARLGFSAATSRINTDFILYVLHYLLSKGLHCFQGPYFSCYQLDQFHENQMIDAIFGSPSVLFHRTKKLIFALDWTKGLFQAIEIDELLAHLELPMRQQFMDACILAGNELCLTHPCLEFDRKVDSIPTWSNENINTNQHHYDTLHTTIKTTSSQSIQQQPLPQSTQQPTHTHAKFSYTPGYEEILKTYPISDEKSLPFDFQNAVEFILRFNHVDFKDTDQFKEIAPYKKDFAMCRAILKSPLSINFDLNNTHWQLVDTPTYCHGELPHHFNEMVGDYLPSALYLLLFKCYISRKLPSVLALGEWLDNSFPCVISLEYYEASLDIEQYRRRALGLIAMHLPKHFQRQLIKFPRYPKYMSTPPDPLQPIDCTPGKIWSFTPFDLQSEMNRQNVQKIDWKFVTTWYQHALTHNTHFWSQPDKHKYTHSHIDMNDLNSIVALVHLTFLENLNYFSDEGGMTAFGLALMNSPSEFQGEALNALEMMKFGIMMGDHLVMSPSSLPDVITPKNPENVNNSERIKNLLIISRVMSLYPIKLHTHDMWKSTIDYDLAGFQSVVQVLFRALKHLIEACVAHIMLQDISKISVLPNNLYNPENQLIPYFYPRLNCMGIVALFFLEYPYSINTHLLDKSDHEKLHTSINQPIRHITPEMKKFHTFERMLKLHFKSCVDPINDLCLAIKNWDYLYSTVKYVCAKGVRADTLKESMENAHTLLKQQISLVQLYEHPSYPKNTDK